MKKLLAIVMCSLPVIAFAAVGHQEWDTRVSLMGLLVLTAFVTCILSIMGKCPPFVATLIICVILLLVIWPG